MTHPFHPLAGHVFDLVVRKNNWAEDRVFVFTDDGQLTSIPAAFTDVDPPRSVRGHRCWAVGVPGGGPARLGGPTQGAASSEGGRPCKAEYAVSVNPILPLGDELSLWRVVMDEENSAGSHEFIILGP